MKKNANKNTQQIDKDFYNILYSFHQNEIVNSYKNFFIVKKYNTYELWKFNETTNEIIKINLGDISYLKIKNNFLIVQKVITDDFDVYCLNVIYELPSFNKIISSSAYGIDIREENDFYIIDELDEDNNGDLYTKKSRIVNKDTKKEIISPWIIRNDHRIRNINKNSQGNIEATIYDYKNNNGIIWSNGISKKGFKKFCKYDNDKILIYDDLEHSKVVNYNGNLLKEIKINIKLKESEHLILNDFKNGYASYKIYNSRPDFCWYTFLYGIIDLDGNKITPNYEYLYMLDNSKYIFEKDFKFYISDISKTNEKKYIGNYIPKIKNEYILCNDNNNCIFLNTDGDNILSFPFYVDNFNIKNNLVVFETKKGNIVYDLNDKTEIISCPLNITIINEDTIIIDDKITNLSDLNKKQTNEQFEEESCKTKSKFLSKFNFKKRKM